MFDVQTDITAKTGRNLPEFPISTGPGDFFCVRPESIHFTGIEHTLYYFPLILNKAFCRASGIDPNGLAVRVNAPEVGRLFRQLVEIYYEDPTPVKKARLQAAVLHLLIELQANHADSADPTDFRDPAFSQIKEAIVYLKEHYDEKITLDSVAAHTLTNKYRLCRRFKEFTGLSVMEYLNEFRCQSAAGLIRNGMRVSEAAQRCGFSNLSFFTRTFRKYTGKLPSQFKPESF